MALMVRRAQTVHETMPVYLQRKSDANALEQMAERAAAVWHIGKELQMSVPVSDKVIEEQFYALWAGGSEHVDVEIQAVLLDKSETFSVKQHVPCLKKLIDELVFSAPVTAMPVVESALAVDEFNLLMKQLEYDVNVYENWRLKCGNVLAAHEHKKQEHRAAERLKCTGAAELFVQSCCKFLTWESGQCKAEQIIGEIMNYKREHIAKKVGCNSSEIPALLFLNWASPSLIPGVVQDAQMSVLGWALHDNMQSCGLAFSPVFAYSQGKLHLEESKMVNQLTKGNHNIDIQFSLIFGEQCDARDLRPMVYPGRFILPSPLGNPDKSMWFKSELRRTRRSSEVRQLTPKDMKEIEDLSIDALPVTSDIGYVHGAAKYCQLGVHAWQSSLSGMFNGVSLSDVPAIVLIDLYPRVGDLSEAFAHHRASLSSQTSLFLVVIAETQVEQDWHVVQLIDKLADKYEDGTLSLHSGKTKVQKDIPADLLEPLPQAPRFNHTVLGGEHGDMLQLPVAIVKSWHDHPMFGQQFSGWLDEFVKTYSVVDPATPLASSPGKRKNETPECQGSPKNAKVVSQNDIVDTGSITEALLHEVKMHGKDMPVLQIRSEHKIYLVNKSGQEQSLSAGAFVAGFGKGSFKLLKGEDAEAQPNHILYGLKDDGDTVVFNGHIASLGKVVADQRSKKPDAAVCYHSIALDMNDPKKFKLTTTHNVVFVPTPDDSKDASVNNVGPRMLRSTGYGLETWTSETLEVLWAVRWTVKGLQAIKPEIRLKQNVTLPPGKACCLK